MGRLVARLRREHRPAARQGCAARAANLTAAIGYYRSMFAAGTVEQSPLQPTLYLHGTDDGAFGVDGVGGTAAHLSDQSRVDILDGVGHFLHLEDPTQVNATILDWLRPG
jgi:pimeloyl-ACP methyl ester carboxylesterase